MDIILLDRNQSFGGSVVVPFQQALSNVWHSTSNRTFLYQDDSCEFMDCSTTCADVNLAFRTGAALSNCMVFPLVAQALALAQTSLDAAITAYNLGIYPDANYNYSSSAVFQCLKDYWNANYNHTTPFQPIN